MYKLYSYFLMSLLISYTFGIIRREKIGKITEKGIDEKSIETNVKRILDLFERKIPAMERDISKILEKLSKNKQNELDRDTNKESDAIKNMTIFYEAINRKLDILDEKISKKVDENFIQIKLDEFVKNVSLQLDEKIKCQSVALNNATNLHEKKAFGLEGEDNKTFDIIHNVTHTLNTRTSPVMEKTPGEIVLRLGDEVSVSRMLTKTYSTDSAALKNIMLKGNSTGQHVPRVSYVEIHFSVEADECVGIQLSDKENISDSDIGFYIDIGRKNNQFTVTELQYKWRTLRRMHTPNILASTEFFIKIDDDKLEFGKEGIRPFISYNDARFRSVNYYTIGNWFRETNNRYNCSARVEALPCKEVTLGSNSRETPPHSMDNESLNHVMLLRNSDGHLISSEKHIAIEAAGDVCIRLSDKGRDSVSDIRYHIHVGWEDNQYTMLELCSHTKCTNVQRVHTPNILSSTEFRAFYLKLDDGKLEFGKEGGRSPLISFSDTPFRSVNYFTFGSWVNVAKFRYDCPAPVEEIPCKEEPLKDFNTDTPLYSMDNETLNHVTLKRDFSGHLTTFEIHIAIEAESYMYIHLMNKGTYTDSEIRYDIEVGSGGQTYLYNSVARSTVQQIDTPNILTSTEFKAFYIKIDNGNLMFGQEGDSSPLISYYNDHFRSIKFFQFQHGGEGNIRYDCPVPVTGSS